MSRKVYLTTVDNPHNPATDFRSWFIWDIENGYNTCQLLDNLAITSESLSDNANMKDIEQSIDDIIRIHGNEI